MSLEMDKKISVTTTSPIMVLEQLQKILGRLTKGPRGGKDDPQVQVLT